MNMKITKWMLSAVFLLFAAAVSAADFVQNGNQIIVRLQSPEQDGPRLVCLQVVGDRIIRVRATAEDSFSVKQSLIIVPQTVSPDFRVAREGDIVVVRTSKIKAGVNLKTGRVAFYHPDNRLYLQETAHGGKMIRPYVVPTRDIGVGHLTDAQRKGWSYRILFDSPSDEAFYGLGQHQAGELDMKGLNEDLFQYNTKVSVPFVVSNHNYGILWDSYSYCRFGNPNPYQQLNHAFTLYDRNGKSGALTGVYTDKAGKTLVRREDSLYFEYACPPQSKIANATDHGGIQNFPKGFSLSGAKVVYEGYLQAPVDNNYHFILYYAGYIKVYLGGKLVVPERWRTAWNPNAWKFIFHLKKGLKVPVRIEWSPDGDVSYCGLRAATPESDAEQGKLSIWSEMSRDIDYYFVAGENLDDVISGYRTLTGKAPVYPKWTLGFWQSRERYHNSFEVEQTMAEFRKRHIPVDNIVQDWNYWKIDSWGDHTFEAARYPNPQAMLDSIHQLHGRFMISVWPKFYTTVKNYKELDSHGWIYHQAVEDSIKDWLGYTGSFYDAYAPGARQMFWNQLNDSLYSKYHFGIDAWWMDASEPNVRDCTPMWYRKALCGPTYLGSSTEYFNAYALMNAEAIYNGQRQANPDQRVFLLTRSGFAGLQRYGTATWSGDIGTRWEDMSAQITAGLNYSLSGLPFWGMDIGGFSVENRYMAAQALFDRTGNENKDLKEWRELQTRWNELGCFVPLYRTHGQWPLREVWNIAPDNHPAYQAIVSTDRFRYRMMPYLYSLDGAVHFRDYTLMRALVMDFNGDPKVYDIKDQWMFGPAFMACPVTRYLARSRRVYLPKQRGWYDLWSGKHYAGGQTIVAAAPYNRIPVFVPEGAIIPFGPAVEWSDETPAELIDLYVYQGTDGKFTLYEDEGVNYNYEKGEYAEIPLSYSEAHKTLTIGKRKGSFKGMLRKRRFHVVFVRPGQSHPLDLEHSDGVMIAYDGQEVSVRLQ
jgi:alpha-D-xyloside xylohydrolase